jgi:hypothetical protein
VAQQRVKQPLAAFPLGRVRPGLIGPRDEVQLNRLINVRVFSLHFLAEPRQLVPARIGLRIRQRLVRVPLEAAGVLACQTKPGELAKICHEQVEPAPAASGNGYTACVNKQRSFDHNPERGGISPCEYNL